MPDSSVFFPAKAMFEDTIGQVDHRKIPDLFWLGLTYRTYQSLTFQIFQALEEMSDIQRNGPHRASSRVQVELVWNWYRVVMVVGGRMGLICSNHHSSTISNHHISNHIEWWLWWLWWLNPAIQFPDSNICSCIAGFYGEVCELMRTFS